MWSNHLKMFTVFNSLLAHLQRSKNPQTHNCSTLIMLKSLDLVPSPPNHAIFFSDTLPMTIYISWSSFVTKWPTIQNIYSKLYSTMCANTYREGTTSEVNRIIVIRNGKFLEGNLDRVFAATSAYIKYKHWMSRKIKTFVFSMWPASWSTNFIILKLSVFNWWCLV